LKLKKDLNIKIKIVPLFEEPEEKTEPASSILSVTSIRPSSSFLYSGAVIISPVSGFHNSGNLSAILNIALIVLVL